MFTRGVKLEYQYTDQNGETQIVYARNLAEAQRMVPPGTVLTRSYYYGR